MTTRVAVVGSANLDMVALVRRFPRPGETVLGTALQEVAGGKGLNQAVAARRATPTAFIGALGDDSAGDLLRSWLERSRVDTSCMVRHRELTGRAFIQVNAEGENSIVVLPLANQQLDAATVTVSLDRLRPVVVLCQLEVPLPAIEAAASWASSRGARLVLNASPMRHLAPDLIARCDPLVVNVGEARELLSAGSVAQPVEHMSSAELAEVLAGRCQSVVVTDGANGAQVATAADGVTHAPSRTVQVVDTTGAGDEFAGTLAAQLAAGSTLVAAAQEANAAAVRVIQLPREDRGSA